MTTDIVVESFNNLWVKFIDFLPTLILAIVLLFIGFLLAWLFDAIARKILRVLHIETIFEKVGLKGLFEKAGLKFSFTRIFGTVVYWFVLIVFLAAIAEILKLTQIQDFMSKLVAYLPNVVAAVVILVIGLLVANLLSSVVRDTTKAANLKRAEFLASLTKWSIFIFALIAALVQLKIAPELLKIFFTGLIAMLAIAGGLAFGLGGKDAARELIDRLKGKF